MPPRARVLALAVPLALAARPARALDPFEIQVYDPEIHEPGQLGIELHSNYTASGERVPAYPGQIPPHHAARFTLEPAVGVTSWLELGAYLQTLAAPGEGWRFGGTKLRAKVVAPGWLPEPFFLGVNFEVALVPAAVAQDPWSSELRPFVGYRGRWLLVSVNPIVGATLSGKDRFRPALEPALKIAVDTQRGFSLGMEHYAELGFVDAPLAPRDQAHVLLGVLDLLPAAGRPASPWELNVAVGGALTGAGDQRVVVKTIFGRSF